MKRFRQVGEVGVAIFGFSVLAAYVSALAITFITVSSVVVAMEKRDEL